MQKFSFLLLLFTVALSIPLSAQEFEAELKAALKTKPRFDLKLDSRNSFINQNGVRVFGFKIGMTFDRKLSFGLGYNQLWSELNHEHFHREEYLKTTLEYYYLSPYVDYIFYEDKRWELSIPVQFGLGESWYQYEGALGNLNFSRKFVLSYEPAITFQYRFLKYFGAGMGVGYRLMIVPNNQIEEQFTSPVYLFKLKVYFQDLYGDFVRK